MAWPIFGVFKETKLTTQEPKFDECVLKSPFMQQKTFHSKSMTFIVERIKIGFV